MKFELADSDPTQAKADVLCIPVFEAELRGAKGALKAADAALEGALVTTAEQEGFKGKAEQTHTLFAHGKLGSARVLLLGLGARKHRSAEAFRAAAGRAAKASHRVRATKVALALADGVSAEEVRACVEGFVLGGYRFDRYRSGSEEDKRARVESVALHAGKKAAGLARMVELGEQVALATNWARDLVNEPAAVVTPARLASEAQNIARAEGLSVKVQGRKEIEQLKMGMFLAVARGSVEEPKLVQLSYIPKAVAHAKKPPLVFVGKAITFDSGGLSLKTADGMVDMKTDMAGAAAVLGAMKVVAAQKPPFPVHAVLGACENMPSGNAYRPGDILLSRAGKTVEVTNTDAEGRLVLGDVLAWANDQKPALMVDLATLTGACVVALGNYIAGAFAVNDDSAKEVLAAARRAGEEFWRMPISDLQKDALRSDVADMKNSGERWGAAINAAIFLREFVGDTPWVHLDIAGPSQSPKDRAYYVKGATGIGVRTLVELVRGRMAKPSSAGRGKRPAKARAAR